MNKILVSDFDGTFYIDDDSILENVSAVKRFMSEKNLFIFATGRSYSDFSTLIKKYNLEYDYLILNHGATIMDRNNNILKNDLLDLSIVKTIISDLYIEKSLSNFCCSLKSDRATFNDNELIKINVKYKDTDFLKKTALSLNKKCGSKLNIYISSDYTLEIVSKSSTKSNALLYLINNCSFKKDNIYTVGDNYTDIDMIKKYNGFTVENCIKELDNYKKYKSVSELIKDIMDEKV